MEQAVFEFTFVKIKQLTESEKDLVCKYEKEYMDALPYATEYYRDGSSRRVLYTMGNPPKRPFKYKTTNELGDFLVEYHRPICPYATKMHGYAIEGAWKRHEYVETDCYYWTEEMIDEIAIGGDWLINFIENELGIEIQYKHSIAIVPANKVNSLFNKLSTNGKTLSLNNDEVIGVYFGEYSG